MQNIEISFVENARDSIAVEKSFSSDSLVEKILNQNKSVQIPKEQLNKNIKSVLDEVSEIFLLSNDASHCYIDEIEFGISISVEGKVSLLSVIGGGVAANSSMVIKMKRRENNEG